MIQSQPRIGSSAFTANRAKFLPRAAHRRWPGARSGKTVLRAGFGMYNDLQDALGYRDGSERAFQSDLQHRVCRVSTCPFRRSVPGNRKTVPGGVQPDMYTPTLISYSLRVEQELSPNTAFTIGYVGSHGYHEIIGLDDNEPTPVICPASPCPATYPSSPCFRSTVTGLPVPAGTLLHSAPGARSQAVQSSAGQPVDVVLRGRQSYNALRARPESSFQPGFSVRGVYTWSRSLDDGDSLNGTTAGNAPGLVSNPFDIKADWGSATYDVRT